LLLDLLVLHRGAHEVSVRDAAWSTAGFIAIAVAFGIVIGFAKGWGAAEEFFAGYLLEKSLSLDNVFVWALIFSAFSVPTAYQHRLLFYGIFGALILRGGFVAAGAELLALFDWIVYVFGALLLVSGLRLLRRREPPDPRTNPLVRFLRRRIPTTHELAGAHLFVPAGAVAPEDRPLRTPILGRWLATPLLVVLVVIELSDIFFAVDSIPAIFGVTREPFIVFSATALALLGLRSMYFLLASARTRFEYLDLGLAAVLIFVGLKFILERVVHIAPGVSLAAIVVILGSAMVASLVRFRRGGDRETKVRRQ
jgi:tellurite resistance protein TerC